MTIDYDDIVHADLSPLQDASKAWKKMGDRYGTLHTHYSDHVKAAVNADTWRGYSVLKFKDQARTTLEEYAGARDEARAVSGQLDEAYTLLKACKDFVIEERDAAEKFGMDVDARGKCTINLGKMDDDKAETYRRNQLAREETEQAWNKRIADAVKATREADENIHRAMVAEPDDGDKGVPNGFNGALKSDVGAANADRADELYEKVKDGDKLNAKERDELTSIVAANKKDPEFSRTLLNSLGGPEGVIKTHNKLDDLAYFDAKGEKKDYLSLDRGLATALASATGKDSDGRTARPGAARAFASQWREEMKDVGLKKFDLELAADEAGGQKVRGYQSMVSLMQRSGTKFDGDFLHGFADDIRAAEDPKKGGDKDVWDLEGDFYGEKGKDSGVYDHSGKGRFANDPLDGVLDVMSKNPSAATEYLDPGTGDGKDRLDYLKNERDWELVDKKITQVSPNGMSQIVQVGDEAAPDVRSGYGAALEAAATGNAPGTDAPEDFGTHSKAEIRVFEHMVESYGADAKHDPESIPGNLRQNMANAVAAYPHDVHDILGVDMDHSNSSNATDPNGVSVSDKQMHQFLRGISEDGGAFRTVHDSQARIIAEDVAGLDQQDFAGKSREAMNVTVESGRTMGSLDEIRASVLASDRDGEIDRNNWNKTYQYHAFGAPVTGIPYVGDSVQRLIDVGTGQHAAALNQDVTNKTREQLIEYYSDHGYPRLRDMLEERARETGVPQADLQDAGSNYGQLRSGAENAYNAGIGSTQRNAEGFK
ncbi:DUF6571 family protein [Streptomyces iconiensis]|uniref:DUF6571 domain-containing protein n=1 Tax=Streptomyces iconiensis TaxID=1384038 RepID=A0ABT6ZWC4_9ACTN|nr:DUF6571 family protein [Streptomyces iconiensis]MDJ1133370.1 hypothetical protein [Streptomyces iconiensis]